MSMVQQRSMKSRTKAEQMKRAMAWWNNLTSSQQQHLRGTGISDANSILSYWLTHIVH
jgi:hypothetical protein